MDETKDRDTVTKVTAGQVSIEILPRAELWALFAAAAMGTGDAAENTALAAKAADRMIAEFEKRFVQAEKYEGPGWIAREQETP